MCTEDWVVECKRRIRRDEIEAAAGSAEVNASAMARSRDADPERSRLEKCYGQVWSTSELGRDFEVLGFAAPIVVVRRRVDGRLGSLEFQHRPRFYFAWTEDRRG